MKTKMTEAEWNSKCGEVSEAVAAAGYELRGDGMLHRIGEMFEDSPEPAIEPEMLQPTIGYSKGLLRAWAKWEANRRGW